MEVSVNGAMSFPTTELVVLDVHSPEMSGRFRPIPKYET